MTEAPYLVTGGSGQVGAAVVRHATRQGISVLAPPRTVLDLSDASSIRSFLSKGSWRAVINCAAYTAVDCAENDAENASLINAAAPSILAQETAKEGIPIIHVSTDYVFDGLKAGPYLEEDPVNPMNVYGRTKALGEAAVREANPRHAIVRTAWVLSADGTNFLNTMLRLRAERAELGVVCDQFGCPTSADDIADALLTVAERLDVGGTWHFVNDGNATWYDLAAYIFAETARRGMPTPKLKAIATAEYPTVAKRPANSKLSTAKIRHDFGINPRPWNKAIDAILSERLGQS